MNNFLKDLGINFSKDPETQKEAAAKKQIKESEKRRDALIDALNANVSKIELQNKDFFEMIGRIIYEKNIDLKSLGVENTEIETAISEIQKNEAELIELDKKKDGIIERYNEEIEILKSAITKESPVDSNYNNAQDETYTFCNECGNKNPSDSIFCSKCGNKIIK